MQSYGFPSRKLVLEYVLHDFGLIVLNVPVKKIVYGKHLQIILGIIVNNFVHHKNRFAKRRTDHYPFGCAGYKRSSQEVSCSSPISKKRKSPTPGSEEG